MFSLPRLLSFKVLLVAVIALVVLKRVHYELTTGARRRRMIKEHGCQPAWQYPHKGILGKTLGIDLIKDIVKAGKEERPNQATRERFYMNGRNTVKFHLLRTQCMTPPPPDFCYRERDGEELSTDTLQSSTPPSPRSSKPSCRPASRIIRWGRGEPAFLSQS
jgi:hypothetical protein